MDNLPIKSHHECTGLANILIKATKIRVVQFDRGDIYFDIDGDGRWIWKNELKSIFSDTELIKARTAFIDKLENLHMFASEASVHLIFPELSLLAKMDRLTR